MKRLQRGLAPILEFTDAKEFPCMFSAYRSI